VVAALVTVAAIAVVAGTVDTDLLERAGAEARQRPGPVTIAVAGFGLAFVLRTLAWRRVLVGLSFGHAWSGIHVAVGANHLLPLRLGEPLRALSVARRADVPLDAAAASTITLRAADVLTMMAIGVAVSPSLFVGLVGNIGWLLVGAVAVCAAVSWRWLLRVATGAGAGEQRVRMPDVTTIALTAAAWLAESVVVWEAARWVGLEITWPQALLIAVVAVGAQIAAIAPGGFGTYEAASVAAYVALGFDADTALVASLGAHALKTAYSLVTGALAVFLPAPSLLGRFRLRRRAPDPEPRTGGDLATDPALQPDSGPVLLFMPAYNEEASVAACIKRAPTQVLGRPVEVLVIDDGSVDATAEVAAKAGAEVYSLDRNRGLGAAVRVGLAQGVARGSAAVVFCDADGEYPPEELANLVRPILDGEADYVTGSRFLGDIEHMHPHRRIGNIVLTTALSLVANRKITDGQTGYRAFSPAAAAQAEIIHDFNYAQVITLDLLAKGFRMVEVPISYRFRTEGESFIKLGSYLRNVVPAVYRELNATG
jgi:uncharacterized membrane protein YbhN (UPF0104 family)